MEMPAWMIQLMQAALKVRQPGSVCRVRTRSVWLGGLKTREQTQGDRFGVAAYVVVSAGYWAGAVATVTLLHAIWSPGRLHGLVRTKVLVRVGCSCGSDRSCEAWHNLGSTCSCGSWGCSKHDNQTSSPWADHAYCSHRGSHRVAAS